ncbi:uncharacterized protein VTP21DRAFT_11048 [Calcarisporiella thermophila]|uniref:uncharacterized protein n=1 Tax=Calcarisporiella thermophila TaxID=911321 RepID=UPI003741EBB1
MFPRPGELNSASDDAVRRTNDDAVIGRLSAANIGYLNDPFVQYFVKRPVRRPPIINRGTFIRTTVLDRLIQQFLAAGNSNIKKQVVSLGAGSDTRFFCYKAQSLLTPNNYFEIDYPEITANKIAILRRNQELCRILGEDIRVESGGTELHTADFHIIPGDLRHWESKVVPSLVQAGLDLKLPTLFLSECVLIYLDPHDSDRIVEWVGNNMATSMFVVYEQILPNDAFGSVMIQNLKQRGLTLKGIHAYPTLECQRDRYLKRGWTYADSVDIEKIHDRHIDPVELTRISRLEMLDEFEEWRLLARHYCIAWAYKAQSNEDSKLFDGIGFIDYHKPAS